MNKRRNLKAKIGSLQSFYSKLQTLCHFGQCPIAVERPSVDCENGHVILPPISQHRVDDCRGAQALLSPLGR